MKVKELINKLLELRDMELEVILRDDYSDYDIGDVEMQYGRAYLEIKDFEKGEN